MRDSNKPIKWSMLRPGVWRAGSMRGQLTARKEIRYTVLLAGNVVSRESWVCYAAGGELASRRLLAEAKRELERWAGEDGGG